MQTTTQGRTNTLEEIQLYFTYIVEKKINLQILGSNMFTFQISDIGFPIFLRNISALYLQLRWEQLSV